MVVGLTIGTLNRNRDYRTAQALWEDTVAKVPYNTRALTCLAVEYLRAGKIDEALVCLAKASENSQNEPSVRANYGLALLRKGLHQETDDPNQGKDVDVEGSSKRLPLAEATLVSKGLDELRASVQLRPSNAHSLALILAERAKRAFGNGYVEAAEILYSEAVKLDPENAEALYYLGGIVAMAGRDAEAIGYYERLLHLVPPTAQQLTNLGALYARNGKYREALERTQQALTIDPGYESARQNLVKIQAALGNP
jgi:Flp pilus assembly protein TadD